MVDEDAATIAQLVVEIAELPPMEIAFRPSTVLQLTGLLQLALRHPTVPSSVRDSGERFVSAAREYFAQCPATLDVIRRGDDPNEDR